MAYAAIMVHLGAEQYWDKRARLAADLAIRFQSALIGVAGWLPVPAVALDGIAENERQKMTALLAEMGESFRTSTKHVSHVEWRGILDYPRTLVPREARAADLLVIGRERVAGDPFYALNPGVTIIRAGRPVLVVPNDLEALSARRVVVAWKDTRESRRAVRDALPFLPDAEEVMVVEVSEHGADQQSQKSIDDVTDYLARHKVLVAAKAYLRTRQPPAQELLRFAAEEGADLVVAGGYGRSRLGEWIFGGVTRDLLADSPVCCLFSH